MMTTGITLSSLLVILGIWGHSFSRIPELFKLNKQCQEEGYYMAEFEFKMLGLAYWLDKGEYVKAVNGIRKYHKQLKTREGLVKVPKFNDKREEYEFYLNLQNPNTGAFMDDSYPYCTYEGPTGNVLLHLDELAKSLGEPLQLKYQLKFYDEINTPEKLTAYLNDLANIGWLASKLPESSFHIVRDMASYSRDDDIVNKNKLYAFSPEWKQTLLKWLYDNQDPKTGYWGPRSRSDGKLLKLDLHNTGSIVKSFVDAKGNDLHPSFPLRYKNEMFTTTLDVMAELPPATDDLDDWHAYTLRTGKGVMLLTRYLWKEASNENKAKAQKNFEAFVRIIFDQYYVSEQGAFSYYPASQTATLDGTGSMIGNLTNIGAFHPEKQRRLWGNPDETCTSFVDVTISELNKNDFDSITTNLNINSVRFYTDSSYAEDYNSEVTAVYYPRTTPVLDIVELVPKLKAWIDTTSQSMGNWISREETLRELASFNSKTVPVFRGEIPLENLNKILMEQKALTVIGFDVLQIPRLKITFRLLS